MLRQLLRALANLVRIPLYPLYALGRIFGRPRGSWVHLKLGTRIEELPRKPPFWMRFVPALAREQPTSLVTLRRLARTIARDPKIRGVVVEMSSLSAGWATCTSVRDVLRSLAKGGKEVVAYLPEGGGTREIFVASGATRIFTSPHSHVVLLGVSLQSQYVRPLLHRFGVVLERNAHGMFKTAAENLARDSMSDAQRTQLSALLDTIDATLVAALCEARAMKEEDVRALIAEGYLRGESAKARGLVDAVCYPDELPERLGITHKDMVRAPGYFAFHRARFFTPLRRKPYIAVVEVRGPIGAGRSGAGLQKTTAALRAARRDRRARAVILHVDSPGGSATVSDLLHREVVRLREKKPVVAYFGNVAASGGYYVAAPADAIIAQATTVTGSIGVVSAKVVVRGFLDMVGVRTETLRSAPHADMLSPMRSFTDEERALLTRETDGFYRAFVEVVAAGRSRTYDEIDVIAQGRVWSGRDALMVGLVDKLGGFDVALDEARTRAGVGRLAPRLVAPKSRDIPPDDGPSSPTKDALDGVMPLFSGSGPLYWTWLPDIL